MPENISAERLLELTKGREHFSETIPGLQHAWDSVTLGLLKTCAYKYYLTAIEGFSHAETPPALKFGICFHAAMEVYDKARAEGLDHFASQKEAVKYCILNTFEKKKIEFKNCPACGNQQEAKLSFCRDCGNQMDAVPVSFEVEKTIPWTTDDKTRNWLTLLRAVVWYSEEFKDDPLKTMIMENGKPAVELSYRWGTGVYTPDQIEYTLCGHLDRVVEFSPETYYIADKKTTKQTLYQDWFNKFKMDNQMTGYTLSGKIILHKPIQGVVIDAIQLGVNFARFRRGITNRTDDQLDEWLENTQFYFRLAEVYAENRYWPMNEMACDHYGGCHFREFCSKTPTIRRRMMESEFTRKQWNPLETR